MSLHHGRPRFDVDLISLRALIAIAETGSFSAAATRIGRTQSAVSLQVARLESRLGVRLYERTPAAVRATAAGETLTRYARRLVDLADEALEAVTGQSPDITLRIGLASNVVSMPVNRALARLSECEGAVPAQLSSGPPEQLRLAFDAAAIDVLLDYHGVQQADHAIELPMTWAGRTAAIVAEQPVPLATLIGPCAMRDSAIKALVDDRRCWLPVLETDTLEGLFAAVSSGACVAALPRCAVSADLDNVAEHLPLLPELRLGVRVGTQQTHPQSARFVELLLSELDVASTGRARPATEPVVAHDSLQIDSLQIHGPLPNSTSQRSALSPKRGS